MSAQLLWYYLELIYGIYKKEILKFCWIQWVINTLMLEQKKLIFQTYPNAFSWKQNLFESDFT